ncbi:MAG: L-ascorbate metabolism protein UlaG (beta-lactamase superfamily) [Cryomorphaceae bacterium]|jgi:L-ascorbate metabolism protein UlaG (beta-lactamase superfamily)
MKLLFALLLSSIAAQTFADSEPRSTARSSIESTSSVIYLGNEGLLVQHGDTKVLFDPFFHNAFNTYQLVPDNIRKALFSGEPPYDNISAIFVSHAHGDHFSADDVADFLQKNPNTSVIAPRQAIDKLDLPKQAKANIVAVDLAYQDAPVYQKIGKLEFDAVRIPHAGWPQRAEVENIIFRVRLEGELTVVHMGDADPDDAHFKPLIEHWEKKSIDAAFPPYWFFVSRSGPMILKDRVKAKINIGIHVPIKVPFDLFQSGEQYFTEPGKGVKFN